MFRISFLMVPKAELNHAGYPRERFAARLSWPTSCFGFFQNKLSPQITLQEKFQLGMLVNFSHA
jgi:hypothetical protein